MIKILLIIVLVFPMSVLAAPRLVYKSDGSLRLIISTREPKQEWFLPPPAIDQSTVHLVDIADGVAFVNSDRKTAWENKKLQDSTKLLAKRKTKKERMARIKSGCETATGLLKDICVELSER